MRINHNIPSLHSQRIVSAHQTDLSKTLEKLSSGLRINRASDDAAGLTISQKMRGQIRGLNQAERNILDGISLVQTAESGLGEIHTMLQRMRELSVQAATGTLAAEDKEAIQAEVDQLKQGIDSVAYETDFNGTHPLTSVYTEKEAANGQKAKVDVVFVIDTSGSMGGVIDNVKANLQHFANGLGDVEAQFGLVQYSDIGYEEPMKKWAFTSDVAIFESNLQDLRENHMYFGGDGPETGLEGIMDPDAGAMSFSFRDHAKKHFVLITDESVHEKGDGSLYADQYFYQVGEVAADLKAKKVHVSVVSRVTEVAQREQLSQLSDETGGMYLDICSDFGTSLNELAESIKDDASSETELVQPPITLQVGANEADVFHMDLTDARAVALNIEDLNVVEDAETALVQIDQAIHLVSKERSKYGAYQNALEYILTNVNNASVNATAAESRISDADMALEMTEYTKRNILIQSGQAMLAQSNQLPQGILQLLK